MRFGNDCILGIMIHNTLAAGKIRVSSQKVPCVKQLLRLALLFVGVISLPNSARPGAADEWIEPSTGMRFVRIHAGNFMMGTPESEIQRQSDETLHRVMIANDFFLGTTEVTQRQWQAVMGSNPAQFPKCGPDCPIESISYDDISRFIKELSNRSKGVVFRLPTEAEWEYACRAGTTTPFATGENLTTDQANYDGRYPYSNYEKGLFRKQPSPVASFAPNRWGLYDMEGNVWEWCDDWYGPYPTDASTDPKGPATGDRKVIRGGSWTFGADSARCGLRYTHAPQDSGFSLGFRLVVELPPAPENANQPLVP